MTGDKPNDNADDDDAAAGSRDALASLEEEDTGPNYDDLSLAAGQVFVPSTPINQRQLFAGRIKQLGAFFDAISTPGQHIIVYGERGVGKTSLVSVAQRIVIGSKGVAVRENCQSADTFAKLWTRTFANIKLNVEKKKIGFTSETTSQIVSLAARLREDPAPDDVVGLLRTIDARIVFVFDEFDQLRDASVAQSFAEVIKALSDHDVASKVVLVGVGDNIDHLIASHASIARALVQIRMPRMVAEELAAIISTGAKRLGMEWDPAAATRVVKLSQGLPHYVHRLGLFATREALSNESLSVTTDDVKMSMKEAIESATQTLTDAYLKATSSQRTPSLFGPVLLACALSKTDDLGYFRPFSIRRPLKLLGHDLDVPTFASHLNKFASDERGNILQKTGTERQYRYRFRDPLMQPYVIMRGISDGACSMAIVDQGLIAPGDDDESEDAE
jgi:Cdc6-like AAA superfamily ATPase